MSFITYKQADSRWGRKNYNGSSTMATAGCGPTSVAMLAYAVDGKTNPWDVAKYMQKHGYAIRNNGTAWSGIPAAMKASGLEDVKNINVDKSMADVWKYLKDGYCAVFLFRAGSRGGVCWTTGGHYVAVTDYKYENGKHWLYTRDSGGRNHTGWYCYETQMRGLIPKVWVGKVPKGGKKPEPDKKEKPTSLPKLPSRGYLQKGDKSSEVEKMQKILIYLGITCGPDGADGVFGGESEKAVRAYQVLYKLSTDMKWGKQCNSKAADVLGLKTVQEKMVDWANKIEKEGTYRYKKWDSKDKNTQICPICNKQTGKYHGWNCIGYVSAICFHGGGIKTVKCSCSGLGDNDFFTKVTEESWRERNGKDWSMISNGAQQSGSSIDVAKLKPGDILICYDEKGKYKHLAFYKGNGKYSDCTSGREKGVGEGNYSNLARRMHVTRAFRYTGR